MKFVAVTQRVCISQETNERRDALDQRWMAFLSQCGFIPILIPNNLKCAMMILESIQFKGIVFTGGNDLVAYGGTAPDRDQVETMLLNFAIEKNLPLLGVCRGMQFIQHHFGIELKKVKGHVTARQVINIHGKNSEVNSYHHYGSYDSTEPLEVWAIANDGVVKAIKHKSQPIQGIMWHPERFDPFMERDLIFTKQFFNSSD